MGFLAKIASADARPPGFNEARARFRFQRTGCAAASVVVMNRRQAFGCSGHGWPFYRNLAQHVLLTGPNHLWVGDITYVALPTRFIYVAIILDAWSRLVVSYAIGRAAEIDRQVLADADLIGSMEPKAIPMTTPRQSVMNAQGRGRLPDGVRNFRGHSRASSSLHRGSLQQAMATPFGRKSPLKRGPMKDHNFASACPSAIHAVS
jgi:hypothetical protein